MATSTVNGGTPERVHELLAQARGLADLIGHVDVSQLAEGSLSNVAWALDDLLQQATTLTGGSA